MEQNDLKQAAASIIDWYAQHKRDLPWRKDKDPYRIWISEIMLQQTRIEAVIPYFERFVRDVPDVSALARVPDDQLMKLWEGLGYYSRARNLKKAAKIIMDEYGGSMPDTAKELSALPGIGDYTAGSLASIAFGQAEPAVDGNVMRVLARFFASSEDIMLQKNRKAMRAALKEVYPHGEDAAFLTEGLMELGERICIPNGMPLCDACPLQRTCRAHADRKETDYPVRSGKKERKIEEKTVLILRCDDTFALQKRPEQGLLAGLWGFPSFSGSLTEPELAGRLEELGVKPESIRFCGKAKHIFTHIEWRMQGYYADCAVRPPEFQWVTKDEIDAKYSIPTAFRAFKNRLLRKEEDLCN